MNKFWHDIRITVTVFFLMVSSVAVTLWIVRETQYFSSPSSEARSRVGSGFLLSIAQTQQQNTRKQGLVK